MSNKATTAATLEGYKLYEPGQVVMNRMQAWSGMFGVGDEPGLVSPDYAVFQAVAEGNPQYLLHLLRSPRMVSQFVIGSKGIGTGFNRLYTEDFGAIFMPFPPPAEQSAIVRFVAALDRRVNRFVRAKRRLIELLTEHRQAIITHAVSGGLSRKAKRKPSGLPWLGEIPSDWTKLRMSRACVSIRDGTHNPPPAVPGMHRLLSVRNIIESKFCLRHDDRTMTPDAFASLERSYTVREGDVVLALVGATTGKSAVVDSVQDVSVQRSLGILRPRLDAVTGQYLNLLIKSHVVQHQIKEIMDKYAAQPGIYLNDLKALQIVLPPPDEQVELLRHVCGSCAELDATVASSRREIELIREYRTRLVADVVTGKLDVRAALVDEPTVIETKPRANIHFQRSVFAAEIIHRLHNEPTFGRVKFEKLMFLCERRCGVNTGSTYHRDAAGPYDNRAIRSIDAQIKKQKWYEPRRGEKGYRYVSLEKAGGHQMYFDRYYSNVKAKFDAVIETFRTFTTQQCEIVATLYSAWEDLLAKRSATDDQIIEQVLNHWHPSKKKIEVDRWRKALGWMKKRGLTPSGE